MKKSTCLVYIILTIVTISTVIALNPAQAVNSFPMTLTVNPTSGKTPLTVSFHLNLGSTTTKNVEWNFGDGTPHDTTNKLTVTHIYQKSGNFTGTVNVISSNYQSQSQVFNVNVGVASTTAPTTINNQTNAHQILESSQSGTALGATLPITVVTDLPSYNQGDTVIIKGTIRDIQNQTAIAVIVRDSLKNIVSIGQPPISSTGIFTVTLKANGPLWKQAGNYTVIAQYGKYQNATTTFQYSGGNGQIIENTPVKSDIFQINVAGQTYNVPYTIKGGTVKSMDIYADKLTLEITIAATTDGSLTVDLPRTLMDAKVQANLTADQKMTGVQINPNTQPDDKFIVTVNGAPVQFTETKDSTTRNLSIPFHAADTKIDIIGTQIVPEFGTIAALVLAIAIISIIAVSAKTGLRFMPKY
ncbi:MAG: PEFG-CTERM sorting domain-containing protein [Thaumarchaeota archaeon]|nr:PEFG-CTERM sorting domain-containing protein [Nitrososphaerota archaeon]